MDQMELHILVAEKLVPIMALLVVVVYLAALQNILEITGANASLAMVMVQLEAV